VNPTRNTRALGRSEIIRHVVKEGWADFLEQAAVHQDPRRPPYVINWSVLQLQGSPVFVMADPFRTSTCKKAETTTLNPPWELLIAMILKASMREERTLTLHNLPSHTLPTSRSEVLTVEVPKRVLF